METIAAVTQTEMTGTPLYRAVLLSSDGNVRSRDIAHAIRDAANTFACNAVNIDSNAATTTSQYPMGPRKLDAAIATIPSGVDAAAC